MPSEAFYIEKLIKAIVADKLTTPTSEPEPSSAPVILPPPSGNNYTLKPARVIYASNKTIARILPEKTTIEFVQDSPCGGFYFNWKGKLYLAPSDSRKNFKLEQKEVDNE